MTTNTPTGKILLIDDDDNVHSVLRYHIERAGFELISAKDTEQAMQSIQNQPNLLAVLVDLHLPRLDVGWALLGKLTKLRQNRLAKTPIVVYSVDDDRDKSRFAGADEHLVKPMGYKDIIPLMKKYAEQRSKAENL
jgi:two-component system alkaline phosphatase synthesis response regulator PhoP